PGWIALPRRAVRRPLVGSEDDDRETGVTGKSALDPAIAARLKRDANGLVAAIAQQHDTGEGLMLAWMDDEALHRTLTTGRCTYWSRSRGEDWVKGETSGPRGGGTPGAWAGAAAAGLAGVARPGGPCHTGDRTCFDAGARELTAP